MALVNTATGEVLSALTETEARDLTDRIRTAAEQTWALLLEAHERGAWSALGYESFAEYATSEFGMSKRHAYRLLDQGEVIRAVEEASGVTHGSLITEREARDIRPRLQAVTDAIRERVPNAPPERVAEIVKEVIVEERQRVTARRAENEAVRALNERHQPAHFDAEADKALVILQQSLLRAIKTIAELPSPADVAAGIPPYLADSFHHLDAAVSWLTEFDTVWRSR